MGPPMALGAVVQLKDVEALLGSAIAASNDLRPVFRGRIGPSMRRHLEKQFDTRGAHLGTPWAPLSLTTIRFRTREVRVNSRGRISKHGARATTSRPGRAKAGFATPMQDSRRLFHALTRITDPEGIRIYEKHRMAWGTSLKHAAPHHQPGGFQTRVFGRGPLKHVPSRPVVPSEMPMPIVSAWSSWLLNHVLGAA